MSTLTNQSTSAHHNTLPPRVGGALVWCVQGNTRTRLPCILACGILMAVMLSVCGCSQSTAPTPSRSEQVDRVVLRHDLPLIENDMDPYADGVQISVYLFSARDPKPIVGNGALEFILLEPSLDSNGHVNETELRRWNLNAYQARTRLTRDTFGLVYRMTLNWPDLQPVGEMALVAMYKAPDRKPIYSHRVTLKAFKKTPALPKSSPLNEQ